MIYLITKFAIRDKTSSFLGYTVEIERAFNILNATGITCNAKGHDRIIMNRSYLLQHSNVTLYIVGQEESCLMEYFSVNPFLLTQLDVRDLITSLVLDDSCNSYRTHSGVTF